MLNRPKSRAIAVAAICAAVAVSAHAVAPQHKAKAPAHPRPRTVHLEKAYFAGHAVKFKSPPESVHGHSLVVGPWNLGEKVKPGPNDFRPNLYFVFPGTEHHVDGHSAYDHNAVLSAVPNDVSNFDVYWVVVLDPTVDDDFTSEQQIIMATQKTFTPSDDFSFEDVPSAGFLKSYLKIKNIFGLEKFKRPDGELPRVAIVPAKVTVKAMVEEIPEQPQQEQASQQPTGDQD